MSKPAKRAGVAVAAVLIVAAGVIAQLIWRFEWRTFLPDLVVAGFTGLAVGLVIWRVQLAAQLADARRAYLREWSSIRSQVARALAQVYQYQNISLQFVGLGADKVTALLGDKPISLWQSVLRLPELDLVLSFLSALDEIQFIADDIDAVMNGASIRYEPTRHYIQQVALEEARAFIDMNGRVHVEVDDDLSGEVWYLLSQVGRDRILRYQSAQLIVVSRWEDLRTALSSDGTVD